MAQLSGLAMVHDTACHGTGHERAQRAQVSTRSTYEPLPNRPLRRNGHGQPHSPGRQWIDAPAAGPRLQIGASPLGGGSRDSCVVDLVEFRDQLHLQRRDEQGLRGDLDRRGQQGRRGGELDRGQGATLCTDGAGRFRGSGYQRGRQVLAVQSGVLRAQGFQVAHGNLGRYIEEKIGQPAATENRCSPGRAGGPDEKAGQRPDGSALLAPIELTRRVGEAGDQVAYLSLRILSMQIFSRRIFSMPIFSMRIVRVRAQAAHSLQTSLFPFDVAS